MRWTNKSYPAIFNKNISMKKHNIIIDDLKISFLQSENFNPESPLIFLHGWQSRAMVFKDILDKCNNFIAIDLPGFGASEKPKEIWGVDEYAKFLNHFLQKNNIKKPILIGHSFGGSIIISYCPKNIGTVKKIILISSAGIREKTLKIIFYKLISKIFKLLFKLPIINKFRNATRQKFYERINSIDYIQFDGMKNIYKKIICQDLKNEMGKIKENTILIWGKNDKSTPASHASAIHSLIKNSKLYFIENADHYCFIDNKKDFDKIFFQEIKS